jgi:hypothetical protein
MSDADANPALVAFAPQDGLVIYDQAAVQRRREEWARHMATVAAQRVHYGAPAMAARAEGEQALEDQLLAGAPQHDLGLAQHHRAAAEQDVDRIAGLLDRARGLARSIGREAAQAERVVAETREAAVTELILGLAEDIDPAFLPVPVETPSAVPAVAPHDDRRLAVATAAVERLEGELVVANDRLADCQRLCRRHASEILVLDAIGLARDIEEAESAIAAKRLSLASLAAVLTDIRRGSGATHLPSRVQRVLVDHADRLVAQLDRGPWQERLNALVAGAQPDRGPAGE